MAAISRIITNICSDDLTESKNFYTKLFNLNIAFDSDWFVQLVSNNKSLELGIIDRTNDIVPNAFQKQPQGFYITFVVENTDAIYEIAKSEKFEIVKEPTDMHYGQRRLLLKDPDGALVDVSSPIKDFEFWIRILKILN